MHVTAHSNEVKKGSIFFALKGTKHDGHAFIESAILAGASEIYCEQDPQLTSEQLGSTLIHIVGDQARKKLGELASAQYQHPTHHLKMIGVTGTSGKTTTTYLIHHLLTEAGFKTARLGTNGGFFEGQEIPTDNTTPDALTLQNWFASVLQKGASHVVMEVSSHALHQDRTYGIAWDGALFLNLSREHMDYHPTLDDYFNSKALLFNLHADYSKKIGKSPISFSNLDQPFGQRLIAENNEVIGFSAKLQIRNLKNTATGIEAEVLIQEKWHSLQCPLFGTFQIENILAALSIVIGMGIDAAKACESLSRFKGVPGRMEFIPNSKGIFVFVDYAHKPEALEKVLLAVKPSSEAKTKGQKLICVFGCGGDRDKTKRPVMGKIATELSDYVFLTSDNPRTEDPNQILAEVKSGMTGSHFEIIPDRALAIKAAIQKANENDIVIIAGKGHEDYQIMRDEHAVNRMKKIHFDDREEARKALRLI